MVQKFKFSLALKARKSSSLHTICLKQNNRILTSLTANQPGVWPQNTPTQWVLGWDTPGAQLVGFEQATTNTILKIGKYT